jgi:hypothetical protein
MTVPLDAFSQSQQYYRVPEIADCDRAVKDLSNRVLDLEQRLKAASDNDQQLPFTALRRFESSPDGIAALVGESFAGEYYGTIPFSSNLYWCHEYLCFCVKSLQDCDTPGAPS